MQFTPTALEVVIFVLSSLISGLVGFAVQVFLPDNIRSKIIYRMKSWRKAHEDNTVTASLTAKYRLDDPIPLSEVSDKIQSNLSNLVDDEDRIIEKGKNEPGDRHRIEIETTKSKLDISIKVNATPGGAAPGGPQFDPVSERMAKSITIDSEIRTEYSNLRWALELGAQYIDQFQSAVPLDLNKSATYNVTCALESPTVIEDFLAKLSAESVKAKNDAIEVKFEENRVMVRNIAMGDRPDIFDKLQDLIIYYG